jgi:hypothetical protein
MGGSKLDFICLFQSFIPIRNIADTTNAQMRNPSKLIKGYKATVKNTIENTMPKDFGEDFLVGIWLVISDIELPPKKMCLSRLRE